MQSYFGYLRGGIDRHFEIEFKVNFDEIPFESKENLKVE